VRAPASDAALRSTGCPKRGGGSTCGDQLQLRMVGMEFVDIERHLCAGKQAWIVKIAHPEQGSGGARRRCNRSAKGKGRGKVRAGAHTEGGSS